MEDVHSLKIEAAVLAGRKYLTSTQLFLFECMRFVDWAAGKGISPAKGSRVKDPAAITMKYCDEMDLDRFDLRDMYSLATALNGSSPDIPAPIGAPIDFSYKNYKGEVDRQIVTPAKIWYGTTRRHPEPQWFLRGFDHDRKAERDFAMRGMTPPDLQIRITELSRQFTEVVAAVQEGGPEILARRREEKTEEGTRILAEAFASVGAGLSPLVERYDELSQARRYDQDPPTLATVKWEDLARLRKVYTLLDEVLAVLTKKEGVKGDDL